MDTRIIKFIEDANIQVEERLNDRGAIQYLISSNVDSSLRVLSYPPSKSDKYL